MRFFCPPGHISQRTKTFTPNTKGGRRIATTVVVAVAAAESVRVRHSVAIVRVDKDKGQEATNGALVHPKEIVRVEGRPGAVARHSAAVSAGLIAIASLVPNPSRCRRLTRKFVPTTARWKC